MKLTILGSSPAVQNAGGASSGYLIESQADGRLLLECGHGTVGVLQTVCAIDEITAILVSHMHPDHFFDLVPLGYGLHFGQHAPIPLYLPPGGIETLERLEAAVALRDGFFFQHFQIHEFDPECALTCGDLSIRFTETEHYIPAYAMRFESISNPSTTLAFTSDTAWSDEVGILLRGASLALAEAAVLEYDSTHGAPGHMTPERAGQLARAAGVRKLLLTHYWRQYGDQIRDQASRSFGGPVGLAVEGDVYEI